MSPSIRCRWLAVLGLLAACASPAPTAAVHDAAAADATADTAAPKSYAVGVLSMEATGAAGRTLPITLWYPAAPGGQGEPAKYFLGLAASPAGALMNVPPLKVLLLVNATTPAGPMIMLSGTPPAALVSTLPMISVPPAPLNRYVFSAGVSAPL